MRWSWSLVVLSLAVGVVGVCGCQAPVTPRPPAELSLQLGTRQSCGIFSGLDYDTSCMSALHVVVRDVPGRNVVLETCTPLSERRAALGDILRGAPVDRFGGLSAQGRVTFEVHGLHDKGDDRADRCADAAVVDHWLFWGESDPVDLAALNDDGGALVLRAKLPRSLLRRWHALQPRRQQPRPDRWLSDRPVDPTPTRQTPDAR